jgi:hypothetical protein
MKDTVLRTFPPTFSLGTVVILVPKVMYCMNAIIRYRLFNYLSCIIAEMTKTPAVTAAANSPKAWSLYEYE